MPPLIREPALEWAADQLMTVRLSPLTLPSGRVLADFSAFTLTIRADPLWSSETKGRPRGSATIAADTADPVGDGWPVVLTATGANVGGVVTFSFDAPAAAGRKRYALDVVGSLAGGGDVQLVYSTWLTVLPRVTA